MLLESLAQIDELIRSCWSRETCDPAQADWSLAQPARGQCAVTALVVQDLLGGELLLAEVSDAHGARHGFHYWNRLASGLEVDLSRSQFTRGEVVGEPKVVPRPSDTSKGRLAGQYRLLADRVAAKLSP